MTITEPLVRLSFESEPGSSKSARAHALVHACILHAYHPDFVAMSTCMAAAANGEFIVEVPAAVEALLSVEITRPIGGHRAWRRGA